jgi:hypothetical protein
MSKPLEEDTEDYDNGDLYEDDGDTGYAPAASGQDQTNGYQEDSGSEDEDADDSSEPTASQLMRRYKTGYPGQPYNHPSMAGSAPALTREQYDPYRQAIASGPPPEDSDFKNEADEYHAADAAAPGVASLYTAGKASRKTYPSNVRKSLPKGTLSGNPLETQPWHSQRASEAGDAAEAMEGWV